MKPYPINPMRNGFFLAIILSFWLEVCVKIKFVGGMKSQKNHIPKDMAFIVKRI
jgi:hypothetical protein